MGVIWIIALVMLLIGVLANIVAYFLEKKYKSKMYDFADRKYGNGGK